MFLLIFKRRAVGNWNAWLIGYNTALHNMCYVCCGYTFPPLYVLLSHGAFAWHASSFAPEIFVDTP